MEHQEERQDLSFAFLQNALKSNISFGSFQLDKSIMKFYDVEIDLKNPDFDSVMKLPWKDSPFGHNHKRVIDETVRKSKEIRIDDMTPNILTHIGNYIASNLNLYAKPYKVLLYQPGDFFLEHRDTLENGLVKSLVVILPTIYKGGEFLFDGKAYSDVKKEDNYLLDENYGKLFEYIVFDPNLKHAVEEVKDGFRMCITYKLLEKDEEPSIIRFKCYKNQLLSIPPIKCNIPNLLITYRDVDLLIELLAKNGIPAIKVHSYSEYVAYDIQKVDDTEEPYNNYEEFIRNQKGNRYLIDEKIEYNQLESTFESVYHTYGYRGNSPISSYYDLEYNFHCLVNPRPMCDEDFPEWYKRQKEKVDEDFTAIERDEKLDTLWLNMMIRESNSLTLE